VNSDGAQTSVLPDGADDDDDDVTNKLLQRLPEPSDREAVDAFAFDLRWK
jgi:hypothetical protein